MTMKHESGKTFRRMFGPHYRILQNTSLKPIYVKLSEEKLVVVHSKKERETAYVLDPKGCIEFRY